MAHYKLKTDKLKRGDKRSEDNAPHVRGPKPDFRKGSPAKREAESRRGPGARDFESPQGSRSPAPAPERSPGNHATRKIARFTEQTRRGRGQFGFQGLDLRLGAGFAASVAQQNGARK